MDVMAERLAELAVSLHEESSLDDTVDRLLEFAVKAVSCAHAGVIFVHARNRIETVAATDDVVARLDRLQLDLDEGPDIALTVDRRLVVVEDTHTEQRWPRWAAAVAGHGIRSMMGVRIATTESTMGSLNLYDTDPGHFGLAEQQVAHLLTRHAAVALSSAREIDGLWQAIDARNLIGQAQGILMERFGLSGEQAFEVLRRYSQHNNVKLHVIAEQLVESRRLPGERGD